MTQFTNPIGLAEARRQTTAGFSSWGPNIWDAICYTSARGELFKASDIATILAKETGLSWVTAYQYSRAFISYARACPEEFTGPASRLMKKGPRFYLADAPEEGLSPSKEPSNV